MSSILHSQGQVTASTVLEDIAANIRAFRRERRWSQTTLSLEAGLSRRMISAIESGGANISIHSIDQLAQALGVPFARIVEARSSDTAAPSRGAAVWHGADPHSHGTLQASVPAQSEVELWTWALAPGEHYEARSPSPGWHEAIHVLAGTLSIERDGNRAEVVDEGESYAFPAPPSFAFANHGARLLRFVRTVVH